MAMKSMVSTESRLANEIEFVIGWIYEHGIASHFGSMIDGGSNHRMFALWYSDCIVFYIMVRICSHFRYRGVCEYGCDATRTFCHRFKRGYCPYGRQCSKVHIASPVKLCQRFRDHGNCTYGCNATRSICHNYIRGYCAYGEGCWKVHEELQSSGNVREHTASSEVASASTRADPLSSVASHNVGSNYSRERSRSRRRHAPSLLCCVCSTEDVGSVALPCGHAVMCFPCANLIMLDTGKCPICRKSMREIHRVYW